MLHVIVFAFDINFSLFLRTVFTFQLPTNSHNSPVKHYYCRQTTKFSPNFGFAILSDFPISAHKYVSFRFLVYRQIVEHMKYANGNRKQHYRFDEIAHKACRTVAVDWNYCYHHRRHSLMSTKWVLRTRTQIKPTEPRDELICNRLNQNEMKKVANIYRYWRSFIFTSAVCM